VCVCVCVCVHYDSRCLFWRVACLANASNLFCSIRASWVGVRVLRGRFSQSTFNWVAEAADQIGAVEDSAGVEIVGGKLEFGHLLDK